MSGGEASADEEAPDMGLDDHGRLHAAFQMTSSQEATGKCLEKRGGEEEVGEF